MEETVPSITGAHNAGASNHRTAPIGTSTDVYTLGVVSYQLLTGSLPYLAKAIDSRSAAFDAPLEQMRKSGALGVLYEKFGFPNPEEIKGISRSSVSPACV